MQTIKHHKYLTIEVNVYLRTFPLYSLKIFISLDN